MFPFTKFSACGNDFILVDNRKKIFCPEKVPKLCDRKDGVGADGVLLLEDSNLCDFKMHIYNADGSLAEMCGNGVRCLMKFIHELTGKFNCTIETLAGKVSVGLKGDLVEVSMPNVEKIEHVALTIEDKIIPVFYLNTGVPHVVIFDDLCFSYAPLIRHHPHFSPKGTNVNFAKITEGKIFLRTFERGVEGETLACGTGACATALVAAFQYNVLSPITIIPASQIPIEVSFCEKFSDITIAGPAEKIFQGKWI